MARPESIKVVLELSPELKSLLREQRRLTHQLTAALEQLAPDTRKKLDQALAQADEEFHLSQTPVRIVEPHFDLAAELEKITLRT